MSKLLRAKNNAFAYAKKCTNVILVLIILTLMPKYLINGKIPIYSILKLFM